MELLIERSKPTHLQDAQSEERYYKDFYDRAPVGFVSSNFPDGKITRSNIAFARMLGFDTVDNLIGKYFIDLYADPHERDSVVQSLAEFGTCDFEIQMRRTDGQPLWVNVSALRIDNHAEGVVVDITIRRMIEKELEVLREKHIQILKMLSTTAANTAARYTKSF